MYPLDNAQWWPAGRAGRVHQQPRPRPGHHPVEVRGQHRRRRPAGRAADASHGSGPPPRAWCPPPPQGTIALQPPIVRYRSCRGRPPRWPQNRRPVPGCGRAQPQRASEIRCSKRNHGNAATLSRGGAVVRWWSWEFPPGRGRAGCGLQYSRPLRHRCLCAVGTGGRARAGVAVELFSLPGGRGVNTADSLGSSCPRPPCRRSLPGRSRSLATTPSCGCPAARRRHVDRERFGAPSTDPQPGGRPDADGRPVPRGRWRRRDRPAEPPVPAPAPGSAGWTPDDGARRPNGDAAGRPTEPDDVAAAVGMAPTTGPARPCRRGDGTNLRVGNGSLSQSVAWIRTGRAQLGT